MKKQTLFALTAIALLCAGPISSYAATKNTATKQKAAVKTQNANNIQTVPSSKFYAKADVGLQQLRLPGFNMPLSHTTTPTTGQIRFTNVGENKLRFAPNFEFGYHVQNPGFLRSLFGTNNAVALQFNFQTFDTKMNAKESQDMSIWGFNGNKINTTGLPGFNTGEIHLDTDISLYNVALLYKGHLTNQVGDVTYTPYAGIYYSNLSQKYTPTIGFDAGGQTFHERYHENVSTNYIGIGVGDRAAIKLTQNINVFADLNLQLLYAHSSLDASRNTFDPNGNPVPAGPVANPKGSASDSHGEITYRAMLSAGGEYYFDGVDNPNSISMSLVAGIQQWGYLPEVVNTTSSSTKLHLAGSSELSAFVKAGVNVPFA